MVERGFMSFQRTIAMAGSSPSGSSKPSMGIRFKPGSGAERKPANVVSSDPDPASSPFAEMLGVLSKTDRLVLMLRYAEDLTVAEIASVIKIEEWGVRESIARLKAMAREVMKSRGDDGDGRLAVSA